MFQDTGSRGRAEDKLRHVAFTPGDVDTFIAQFESLAEEATHPLNAKSTLTLFASKLPFKMMDHILKIVRPHDFQGWANAARQYHQNNMAVQNVKKQPSQDILHEDTAEEELGLACLVSSYTLPHQNSQPGRRGRQTARSKVLSRRARDT